MKNITVINACMTCQGQQYKVMRFTAETEAEKKYGERPWIAVHHGYTEADLPLNGLQMLISKDHDELVERVRMDATARAFRAENPDATPEDLLMHLAKACRIN